MIGQPKAPFAEFREEKILGSLSPALNVMIKAIKKAGRRTVRDFGEVENLQMAKKSAVEFTLKTRTKAAEVLLESLQEARPAYSFVMDGKTVVKGEDSSNTFYLEPLDGMVNFMHSVPLYAVSAALVRDNELYAGVTYNPITDELFYAERGSGAYLMKGAGDTRLRVSGRVKLSEALIGVDFSAQDMGEIEQYQEKLRFLILKTAGARRLGAASIGFAYLAAGRLDGYWCRFASLETVAVGVLLVREAGGYVCGAKGESKPMDIIKAGSIIASNEALSATIVKALK